MKLKAHTNKLETNVKTESINFGIGDASVVIEILRNRLYSFPIRTLVQEYICNARDAVRESGNEFKIDIQKPTRLEPTFKVRDYGTGISPDAMVDVFVKYGASTKRGTDEQTGGFGIGAKSAWAYTDSFTIVSYWGGMERHYIAHTGKNNNGSLDLILEQKSDQPSGLEIQIAVDSKDIEAFCDAINRACYFWEIKPNGVGETSKGLQIADELHQFTNLPYNVQSATVGLLLSVDGVPYPLTQTILDNCPNLKAITQLLDVNATLVLKIGNDAVDVSADREKIAENEHTFKGLEIIAKRIYEKLIKDVKNRHSKLNSVLEFCKYYEYIYSNFRLEGIANNLKAFKDYSFLGNRYYASTDVYLTNDVFKTINAVKFHNKTKQKKTSNKVFKDDAELITLGAILEGRIFYRDQKESKVNENRRARQFFADHDKSFIVIENLPNQNQTVFKKILKDLGAKKLSSLKMIDKTTSLANHAYRIKKAPDTLTVHYMDESSYRRYYNASYSKQTKDIDLIGLAKSKKTYVYTILDGSDLNTAPYATSKKEQRLLGLFIEQLTNQECELVAIAPTKEKLIDDNPKFIKLDQWFDSFLKQNKTLVQNYAKAFFVKKFDENYQINGKIKTLKDLNIKNKFLNNAVKEYCTFNEVNGLPKYVETKINKNIKTDVLKKNHLKLVEIVNSLFLLNEAYKNYRFKTEAKSYKTELETYINAMVK